MKCWGDNIAGQLGVGGGSGPETCNWLGLAFPCSTTPRDVSGVTDGVAAVSVGGAQTCALTKAGGVKCWGGNENGDLGVGVGPDSCVSFLPSSSHCSTTPRDVTGLTAGVASLSVGSEYACVVTEAGGVKCWGSNHYGQLGNVTMTDQTSPADVTDLANGAISVSAGDFHTCALTTAAEVKCWGNHIGTTPVDVVGLTPGVGDVNCDGATDSIDAVFILQYAAGLLPVLGCQEGADTNLDGHVDARDAALILQFSAGLLGTL